MNAFGNRYIFGSIFENFLLFFLTFFVPFYPVQPSLFQLLKCFYEVARLDYPQRSATTSYFSSSLYIYSLTLPETVSDFSVYDGNINSVHISIMDGCCAANPMSLMTLNVNF